jgi:hypothetical protein
MSDLENANQIYLRVNIADLNITRRDAISIPSGNKNHIYVKFTFSKSWNELDKTALFSRDGKTPITVPIENDISQIPASLMEEPGNITLSVYGGDLITLTHVHFCVVLSGYKNGGPPPPDPPEAIYVQSPNASVTYIRSVDGDFEYFTHGQWQKVSNTDDIEESIDYILEILKSAAWITA